MLSDEIKRKKEEIKNMELSSELGHDLYELHKLCYYYCGDLLKFAKMSGDKELLELTYDKLFELMNMEIRLKGTSEILQYSKISDRDLKQYFQNKLQMEILNISYDEILNENISVLNAINDRKSALSKKAKLKKYLNKYPNLREKIICYAWLLGFAATMIGTAKISHDKDQLYTTETTIYSSADDTIVSEEPYFARLQDDGKEVKITEYTHYVKSDDQYERKIYNYSAPNIELDNIEDYLDLDLYELPVEEIVDYAKELDANDFYKNSIYEVRMIKQDLNNPTLDKEQIRRDIITAFITYICATIILDGLGSVRKYDEDEKIAFKDLDIIVNKLGKLKNGFKKKKIKELVYELEDLLALIKISCELNPNYRRYIEDFSNENDRFDETLDIAKIILKM